MNTEVLNLSDCTLAADILRGKPPKAAAWLLGVAGLLATGLAAWSWWTRVDLVVRVRGRVRPVAVAIPGAAGEHAAGASVGGQVVAIERREGDLVREGDVLLRLDTSQVEREMASAESAVEGLKRELERLQEIARTLGREQAAALKKAEHDVTVAVCEVDLERERSERAMRRAQADLACARLERDRAVEKARRVRELVEAGVEARETLAEVEDDLEQAETLLAVSERAAEPDDSAVLAAEARCETARSQVETVRSEFLTRQEEIRLRIGGKEGAIEAGCATLASLVDRRERHVVRARCGGVVTECRVREGERVEAGQAFMTIARGAATRVEAELPARERARVRVGQEARIRFEAQDPRARAVVSGVVEYVSPDSRTDAQGQVCYQVRVALREGASDSIRIGMPGDVELLVGEERVAALLFFGARGDSSLR